MELKAMCYPNGGPSKGFAVPVTGKNVPILRQIAIRMKGLDDGRKSLNAQTLLAEDLATDRLQVFPGQDRLFDVGFDFQKVAFDCSNGREPHVLFIDSRRDRSMQLMVSDPEIQSLIGMESQSACSFCKETMAESDILKGDGICAQCVVERT